MPYVNRFTLRSLLLSSAMATGLAGSGITFRLLVDPTRKITNLCALWSCNTEAVLIAEQLEEAAQVAVAAFAGGMNSAYPRARCVG